MEINSLSQKDFWNLIFNAALFTITKIWKQPKCPSMDDGENVIY